MPPSEHAAPFMAVAVRPTRTYAFQLPLLVRVVPEQY
jgi:hypothetical protein